MSMIATLVFVYGTLRAGGRLHGYLSDSALVGRGEIRGYVLHDLGAFPGVAQERRGPARPGCVPPEPSVVRGEVYAVTAQTLARLDAVEGEGSLYDRRRCEVALDSGDAVDAAVYVMRGAARHAGPVIPCGDWMEYLAEREGGMLP